MTTPTREQVPNNMAAPVYVFRDKATGATYATYAEGAPNALDDSGLEHVATLEPRAWIAAHFDDFAAGRDQGLREAAAKVRAILADCEQQDIDDPELEVIAAAIEQLRAK